MAMVTAGPAFQLPQVLPWNPPQIEASGPSAQAASGSSLGQDSYGAASVAPAASTSSGVVTVKSVFSNLWDQFLGPLLGGLWNAISSIFHGL